MFSYSFVQKQRFQKLVKVFFSILFLFIYTTGYSQNDDCSNAVAISIPNSGFGLGTFNSTTNDISTATIQVGETFAPAILVAGQNQKSIWYKFTVPTTRGIKVILYQLGVAITAGDAGFAIYKSNACLPATTAISTKLTPIATFGNTKHPCVEPGDYLIQVSSNNKANGPLSIQLEVSAATGSSYDYPSTAYSFGALTINMSHIDYPVDCQSIDDATEVCTSLPNYQQYTKSSWHTFTTPAYFDFLDVLLASSKPNVYFNSGKTTVGYKLYQGDVKVTPPASLTAIGGCDSLVTNGYYADYKLYRCGVLQPNTTYTVQLFFHKDFNDDIRLAINCEGIAPTKAPQPILSTMLASNILGVLPSSPAGVITTATDYLACNSRHTIHSCAPALPTIGVDTFGVKHNLSTFYTFELTTSTNLTVSAYMARRNNLMVSLYKQNLTNTCSDLDPSLSLVSRFQYTGTVNCLSAGMYTLQISGSDSLQPYSTFNYSNISYADGFTMLSNLGQKVNLSLTVKSLNPSNEFSLATPGAYNPVNFLAGSMQPLKNSIKYTAAADTFGCSNTVMPKIPTGSYCNSNFKKAMYREFVIGDADGNGTTDSGIVSLNYYGYNNGSYMNFMLYKGDANALAIAQNAHNNTDTLLGLTPYSECRYYVSCSYDRVCVTPGTYSLLTFGSDNHVGANDNPPTVKFDMVNTKHNTGPLAQNLGSILDTLKTKGGNIIYSDIDPFSCRDNAVTINGFNPPKWLGHPATKAIYRQFYLNAPAIVNICSVNGSCYDYGGNISLFSGQATAGLSGLVNKPINGITNTSGCITTSSCSPLPAGWYTVVSYGTGPTYDSVLKYPNDYSYGSYIGVKNQFTITVTVACPSPKFNRPYKACIDTVTKAPFLIEWKSRVGSTAAYPITDTTYRLYTENLNCTVDTPFASHPVLSCGVAYNRVAYYVFKLTQESYVQINTNGYMAKVFDKDVRVDSILFSSLTPIQPCLLTSYGNIQLCRLQPGTYTLAIFAADAQVNNGCGNIPAPTIYIDKVAYSRFDHASKAYDFGIIPPDSLTYKGKPGDVNPLDALRAPSNDFFYCTTGSQKSDPVDAACNVLYNSEIYNTKVNNNLYNATNLPGYPIVARRNLWYTFVVDKPGYIHVKVANMTKDKPYQVLYALYKSDVNGTLPFSTLVNTGQVDSSITQGLKFIAHNISYPGYCYTNNEIIFYRDPCSSLPAERYYIVVDNRSGYPYPDQNAMNPNHQVEVSVMLDSTTAIVPKFDHYYQASNMGTLGAGKYKGATDNYSCATSDATDPNLSVYSCGTKTLWYKFTSTVTGHLRFFVNINGTSKYHYYDAAQLFREIIPGDSTTKGLKYIGAITDYYDGTKSVGQTCISAGTYYLLLTGCNQTTEYEFPEIEIIEEVGDFCGRPVISSLNGASSSVTTAIVDCHTIGTDYGEFSPNLTCPIGAVKTNYKTSWFKMDIGGTDTLDVTAFIAEKTTATSSDIQYRLMTGDCGAMQEQSCVQDAQTQNTYKCLAPGSYFIQVFTPILKNGATVTGSVDLNLSAIIHADTCAPSNACLANANFIPQFDCNKSDSVTYVNYSTYGLAIKYVWDFGYAGKTSTAVSPKFKYPALPTDKTYTITLNVKNTSCGGENTVINTITIPGRSDVYLGKDTSVCTVGGKLLLNATSWPGAVYYWQNGSSDSTYTIAYSGMYYVNVTYNGCTKKDTINVKINPLIPRSQNFMLCGNDSALLNSNRGYGETYLWNTGATTYFIYKKTAGTYINKLSFNGCITQDTFKIVTPTTAITYHDTTVCSPITSFQLNKTISGAQSYSWQNGASGASYQVTTPGLYWVNINYGKCSSKDTTNVNVHAPAVIVNTNAAFCKAKNYTLPWGKSVSVAGVYSDTIKNKIGCDSIIKHVTLTQMAASDTIKTNDSIYFGQIYTLPWGTIVNTGGVFSDTLHSSFGCDSLIKMVTLIVKQVALENKNVSICYGKTFKLTSGVIASASGIYKDTLHFKNGLDSFIISYNIVVSTQVPSIKTTVKTLCVGQSFTLPSGKVVNNAGLYTDTLRYISGCDSVIESISIVYQTPSPLSVNQIICPGQSYTLASGKIVNTAGVYNDTLRSLFDCDSIIKTINLSIQSIVSVLPNTTTICAGKSTVLTASGSATYLWSTGATTAIATVSPDSTTTYSVTGTTTGCASAANATVFVNSNPIVVVNSQTICMGQAAVLTATGADSYIWSDNSIDNPFIDSPATTTNYTVTGTTTGCKATAIANVTVTHVPAIVVNSATICFGKSAILTASGGSNYTWSTAQSAASVTVSPTSTSTFVVTNTIFGCSKAATATVTVNPLPVVLVNSPTICQGQSTTLTASGAASYNWYNAATTNAITVSPANALTYTVTGNKFGCTATVISTVNITPLPVIRVNSDTICVGETALLIASGGVSYTWSNGAKTNSINVSPPTATSYSVSGLNTVGCSANAFAKVIIGVTPTAEFSFSPNPAGVLDPNITFTDQSTPNVNFWTWNFGDGDILAPNIQNPVHTYPSEEAVYTVTLRVQNPELCSDEVSHTVVIGQDFTFFIPNTVTPDGDNVNDVFGAKGGGIIKFEMLIFNRWGNLVFSADDISKTWNGKSNNATGDIIQDVYVWRVSLTDIFKKEHKYIGTVTVLNGK